MANIELLQAIAHDLEGHVNSIRVRKLILYICKQVWENNLDTLQSQSLSPLIQELIQQYPNLTELENRLNRVARSLSKPAEYGLIANLIIQKIKKLYPDAQPEPRLGKRQQQLPQVVTNLDQDRNSIRIKKILVYICKNIWENDSDRLNQYDLKDLIKELLEIVPSLESLSLVLNSIVKTLNRQTEYSIVATTILTELSKLYTQHSNNTQLIVDTNNTQILAQSEQTNFLINSQSSQSFGATKLTTYSQIASWLESQQESIRIKKLIFCASRNLWENDLSKLDTISLEGLVNELHAIAPTSTELKLLLAQVVNTLNRKAEYSLVAEIIVQGFKPLYGHSDEPIQASVQAELPLETAAEYAYDPFELRLEIMKYTNPLRAKILLFSILKHKFSFTTADWSALSACRFDDLLQQLLEQCDTLSTLESRLEIIASCLEDSSEYNQAAGAIIQCVKPFYSLIKRRQQLILGAPIVAPVYSGQLSSEPTKIKFSSEPTLLTSSRTIAEMDDEHTCQFFSTSDEPRTVVERSPTALDNGSEHTCELPD